MPMNYASSIPSNFNQVFERRIAKYLSKQKDARIARNLATVRNVGASVQTDTVTYFEKSGGNDKINASIVAKGDIPNLIGVKGKEVSHAMYQFADYFMLNERDLNLDPNQQARKVDVATRDIGRLEDYIFMNGDTATGLTGLIASARANPNGRVMASGATGNSCNNTGIWTGADAGIDVYTDVMEGCDRVGDDFDPKFMIGQRKTIAPIRKMDDMRKRYADEILDLFAAKSTAEFIRYSAYVPTGYIYIVAQDMEFMEMVISEDLRVDSSYPKEAGGNYRVELKEWLNPVEFHSDEGAVEISTL